jgi:hypothetical protein
MRRTKNWSKIRLSPTAAAPLNRTAHRPYTEPPSWFTEQFSTVFEKGSAKMIELLFALTMALCAGLLVYLWVLCSVKHVPVKISPKPTPRLVFNYAIFETQTSCGECAFRDPETCKACRKEAIPLVNSDENNYSKMR